MNIQTMSYGSPDEWEDWVLDEEKSLPLLEHAYKVGINTWDTVSSPYLAVATIVVQFHSIYMIFRTILAFYVIFPVIVCFDQET